MFKPGENGREAAVIDQKRGDLINATSSRESRSRIIACSALRLRGFGGTTFALQAGIGTGGRAVLLPLSPPVLIPADCFKTNPLRSRKHMPR